MRRALLVILLLSGVASAKIWTPWDEQIKRSSVDTSTAIMHEGKFNSGDVFMRIVRPDKSPLTFILGDPKSGKWETLILFADKHPLVVYKVDEELTYKINGGE